MNAHQEAAYVDRQTLFLPHSETARDCVILLPMYHDMTADEQARVIGCLRRIRGMARAS
jgi:dTDP-4-amino-4,6-dideoxygalactose transaminase